jgi:peptide/nickel transport system substrate-binding protein
MTQQYEVNLKITRRLVISGAASIAFMPRFNAIASTSGKGLKIRYPNTLLSLDPAFLTSEDETCANIYEGLVTYKPGTWDIVNQLAEIFEPAPDGKSYKFTLKKGIPFHRDFGEVTAADVKFSYERIAGISKPDINSSYKSDWSALEKVDVVDKYSGVIVLKGPFAPLMRTTLPLSSGWILSKTAVEQLGKSYPTQPVGSGPYEMAEWRGPNGALLARFAKWGGASKGFAPEPIFDTIESLTIPDTTAADNGIETREIDMGQIGLESIDRFQADNDLKVYKVPTLNYSWIGMNQANPALADINVRKAIRLAIDVPAILTGAFEGRWERATAIIPPAMRLGYWKDAPVYARDVSKATDYMKAAGVPSLDLKMTVTTEKPGSRQVGQIVQANLAEIGINVGIEVVDGATFFGNNPDELKHRQLFYSGFFTSPDPSWSTTWFTCDQVGKWNWMYWCDKAANDANTKALSELDESKRDALYVDFQKRWDEAANCIWLAWPTLYFAGRQTLKPVIRPDGKLVPWAFSEA